MPQQDEYMGWNTHVIIKRQLHNPSQSDYSSGCPERNPTLDANGVINSLNGICFVSLAYGVGPNQSFAAFIAAAANFQGLIADLDTGEIRWYDGTEAGDEDIYFTPEQLAMGKIKRATPTLSRETEINDELGEMYAASIGANIYDPTLRLDKLYCDKKKLAAVDKDSPVLHQNGFLGAAVLERDQLLYLVQPDIQDYYLVILYTRDLGGDATVVARSWICPCMKFHRYETRHETRRSSEISLEAKGTYAYTVPFGL